jgi:hypothetical protein
VVRPQPSNSYVACLVGDNFGKIEESFSMATVTGYDAGGLVVANEAGGAIISSSEDGVVSGKVGAGGLVAFNNQGSFVSDSHALGSVTASATGAPVGGLVGSNGGWISNSYSADAGTGGQGAYVGGLVGLMAGFGKISNSFAMANVTATGGASVGGLAGAVEGGAIENSYATGSVLGKQYGVANIGGLVGFLEDTPYFTTKIVDSYSTGHTSRNKGGYSGGFVGLDEGDGGIARSYWDMTTSGKRVGTGNRGNEPGLEGRTTTQLQAKLPKGFDKTIWAENSSINGGLPYLIANPPPS